MTNEIQSIAVDRFVPHPDNPNRMSKGNFAKLVRNIKRAGRYEPLVVRPCPPDQVEGKPDYFQIINGHHRYKALVQLGYKAADAIVWDIDDEQTGILLATLNRLAGSDVLDKKLALLKRLNMRLDTKELAKLIPQSARQIERLTNMKLPAVPAEPRAFATPMVFFLNDEQSAVVQDALFLAQLDSRHNTTAAKRAAGLEKIARFFLSFSQSTAK